MLLGSRGPRRPNHDDDDDDDDGDNVYFLNIKKVAYISVALYLKPNIGRKKPRFYTGKTVVTKYPQLPPPSVDRVANTHTKKA